MRNRLSGRVLIWICAVSVSFSWSSVRADTASSLQPMNVANLNKVTFGTIDPKAVNVAPIVTDSTKYGKQNTVLPLPAVAFAGNFMDNDAGDLLAKVRIVNLPSASAGVLKTDGVNTTVGDELNLTSLNTLTFEPALNFKGTASFTWVGSDGKAYSSVAATMTLNIAADDVAELPKLISLQAGSYSVTADVYAFTVTVPNQVTSLDLIAELSSGAVLKALSGNSPITNNVYGNKISSSNIQLGDNMFEVQVTALNGTTFQMYKIAIKRTAAYGLNSLDLSAGTLVPGAADGTRQRFQIIRPETLPSVLNAVVTGNANVSVTGAVYQLNPDNRLAVDVPSTADSKFTINLQAADGSTKAYDFAVVLQPQTHTERVSIDKVLNLIRSRQDLNHDGVFNADDVRNVLNTISPVQIKF